MDSKTESRDELVYDVYIALSIMMTFFFLSLIAARRFYLSDMFLADSSAPIPAPAPSALIEKVFNPFFLQVSDDKDNKENLILTMTSHKSCTIHVAWGPKISSIYPLIHSSWNLFANEGFLADNLQQLSISYEQIKFDLSKEEPTPSKIYKLARLSLSLGTPPRSRYPLVIILVDDWLVEGADSIQPTNDIGALIAFIHLKDEQCPANTHIFDQYVKTHSGKLHNIKPVYVAASEVTVDHLPPSQAHQQSSSSSSSPSTTTNDNQLTGPPSYSSEASNNHICSVCLNNPINKVLLPCRHACICDSCCDRLMYCPMCRNIITSTFDLNCG